MSGKLSERLRRVRVDRGMSLRDFASWLQDQTGFKVSHESIRQYEDGNRVVPSGYLRALARACSVNSDWLLLGAGRRAASENSGLGLDSSTGSDEPSFIRASQSWERFLHKNPDYRASVEIVRVESNGGVELIDEVFDRLDEDDVNERLTLNGSLLDLARPHIRWACRMSDTEPHVASVVDTDGAVLWSIGSDDDTRKSWGVDPGVVWREDLPSATPVKALQNAEIVIVVADRHWANPSRPSVHVATPVFTPAGEVCCVVDLATSNAKARPERLIATAYAAAMIERGLR